MFITEYENTGISFTVYDLKNKDGSFLTKKEIEICLTLLK